MANEKEIRTKIGSVKKCASRTVSTSSLRTPTFSNTVFFPLTMRYLPVSCTTCHHDIMKNLGQGIITKVAYAWRQDRQIDRRLAHQQIRDLQISNSASKKQSLRGMDPSPENPYGELRKKNDRPGPY